jgi:hypothetical protein
MSLNLDKPHEICVLCKYTEQEYLTNLFESLYGSPNVYFDMFNVFSERQKLLERQRLPFLKVEFSEFKHHFEHHVSSLRKVLHDDIDTIKRMKEGLMNKIGTKSLTATEVNTFIKLSTHHVHLTAKIKSVPVAKVEPFKPYEFD